MKTTIGIIDDQQLFVKSLGILINQFARFEIILESMNGTDLLKKMGMGIKPAMLLIDVSMPEMEGAEVARKVAENHPATKTIALSAKDDDVSIIKMLKAGCCSYLVKDIHPNELEKALIEIDERGYYNADAVNVNYRRLLGKGLKSDMLLTQREQQFLTLACSDLTYKQIAAQMRLSERTIDGYRESIFEKMNVASRVGMALEAIKRELVTVK